MELALSESHKGGAGRIIKGHDLIDRAKAIIPMVEFSRCSHTHTHTHTTPSYAQHLAEPALGC